MAEHADLPQNVADMMMAESAGNIQAANAAGRNVFGVVMGVLQGSVARRFDEVGIGEGKTASGILATDVGGPTNAGS